MSNRLDKSPGRLQFSLAAILVLTALCAAVVAMALTDRQLWPMWLMYVLVPFPIGIGVGRFSNSRAQLLRAPPVAAALAPLPLFAIALCTSLTHGRATSVAGIDLVKGWVMMFPVILVLGAPAALLGSAVGYWFKPRSG